MNPVILTQLILFGVAIAGWLTGKAAHSAFDRKSTDSARYVSELPRMTDTIAFISGAVGILLGLLLSVSVSSYQGVQESVKEYGSSAVSVMKTSGALSEPTAELIRHDAYCAVSAFVNTDWRADSFGKPTPNNQADLWLEKLSTDLNHVALTTTTQSQAYPILLQSGLDMGHWSESVMLTSMETIPPVVWFVIFVSAYLLALLLTLHLADRRGLSRLSFGVAYVALATTIYALTVLDYPLSNFGFGPAVSPRLLIDILESANIEITQAVSATCQQLVAR